MKALVIHAPNDLRLEPCDIGVPGNGEVRVDMATGGVCGSDLHYYNHGGFGSVRLREPMVLGHEVSGYISAIGNGVEGLKIGDLVAISPSRPCGNCEYCALGHRHHCTNMRFYGSAMPFPHIQGAFRQAIIANASQCVPATGLTPGEAAMAEPLAVCLHATRRAGEMLGKRVLITGAGPIGVLCVLCARRAGAAEIVVTDIGDAQLQFAKDAGADRVINTLGDGGALTPYADNKGHFEVLMECSGAEPALVAAIPTMRPRGVIVQVGMSGEMTLPMLQITAKELDLRGSFRFHEEFETAVTLMQKRLIDVTNLITHTLPLNQAEDAFTIANDRSTGAMKTQIDFTNNAGMET